ncbi:hypothetical protein A6R68_14152, partial [Neotoma lepida]
MEEQEFIEEEMRFELKPHFIGVWRIPETQDLQLRRRKRLDSKDFRALTFADTVCCILSKAVAKAASGAPRQRFHPAPGLLLSMAGYLSESDFVMVEEGFSTRDLLEELTLGASQATT